MDLVVYKPQSSRMQPGFIKRCSMASAWVGAPPRKQTFIHVYNTWGILPGEVLLNTKMRGSRTQAQTMKQRSNTAPIQDVPLPCPKFFFDLPAQAPDSASEQLRLLKFAIAMNAKLYLRMVTLPHFSCDSAAFQ